MADVPAPAPSNLADLSSRLKDDLLSLDGELAEVDLLITQARNEAGRHETRRVAGAEKVAALPATADPAERVDAAKALVTLTKRAALMETQVEVLEGKRRALGRYRDAVASYIGAVDGLAADGAGSALAATAGGASELGGLSADAPMPPAVSRMVLGAQEDLRREIARAMHDGPAQSLSNIVLQAQIVERLVARDPEMAAGEVRLLMAMVQSTLESTKSFIFDVRPMVLDDLGLVPTLRRATRDRGRRAGIPVEFDSLGQDRRLPMDLESGLFRMIDEALVAYLGSSPDRVTLRVDWSETGRGSDRRDAGLRGATGRRRPGRAPAAAVQVEEEGRDDRAAAGARGDDRGPSGRRAGRGRGGPPRVDRRAPVIDVARDPEPGRLDRRDRGAPRRRRRAAPRDRPPVRRGRGRGPRRPGGARSRNDRMTRLGDWLGKRGAGQPGAWRRDGQGLVEYGLILGLTSVMTVVWLVVFGGAIADALSVIAAAIDSATGG